MKYYLTFLFSCLFLLQPTFSLAKPEVSANYQGKGNSATISVKVGSPAPMAFIILQTAPPGVKLVSATPKPVNGLGSSSAKWLFKQPRSGSYTISMQFSKPVSPGQLQGEIRYRHPGNQAMITKKIH
ncbi:hypothetical protein [Desulfogranum japonicum]|uniref:hypothetical protein n=1 Tax=Desulfogranum japonicum TaxID=231447 RepID=UPI0003F8C86C|nr:hypothetical protein [Desulfogranum japonicum]